MAKGIRTNTPLCEIRKGSFVATAHIALLEEKNNGSFFSFLSLAGDFGARCSEEEKGEKEENGGRGGEYKSVQS